MLVMLVVVVLLVVMVVVVVIMVVDTMKSVKGACSSLHGCPPERRRNLHKTETACAGSIPRKPDVFLTHVFR